MNIKLFSKCRPTGQIRGSNLPDPHETRVSPVKSEGGGSGRVGSGRVKRFWNLAGRVGSGQEILQSHGSGRVGSRGFQNPAGRVGSSQHTSNVSWVGSDTYHNAPWPLNIIIQSIGPNWRERGFPVYLLKKANKYAASMSSLSSTKRVFCTDGIFDSRISSQDHGQPTLYTKQYHNNKHSPTIISKRVCFGAIYYVW